MPLDNELINDVAAELDVDASFIEKDYYAVKVVQAIAGYSHDVITPVFCGGTSLSKGYDILKEVFGRHRLSCTFQKWHQARQGHAQGIPS